MLIFGDEIKILMKERKNHKLHNSEVTFIEYKETYQSAVYIITIWTQFDVKLFKYILSKEIKICLKKANDVLFLLVYGCIGFQLNNIQHDTF